MQNLKQVISSSVHKNLTQLKQEFIPVKYQDKQGIALLYLYLPILVISLYPYSDSFLYGLDKLIEVLKKHPGERTVIFCNSSKRVHHVYEFLKEIGYSVSHLSAVLHPQVRSLYLSLLFIGSSIVSFWVWLFLCILILIWIWIMDYRILIYLIHTCIYIYISMQLETGEPVCRISGRKEKNSCMY